MLRFTWGVTMVGSHEQFWRHSQREHEVWDMFRGETEYISRRMLRLCCQAGGPEGVHGCSERT